MHRKSSKKSSQSIEKAWLFGHKPINEILLHKPERVKTLYFTDKDCLKDYEAKFALKTELAHIDTKLVDLETFERLLISSTPINHQGVSAQITPNTGIALAQLIQHSVKYGRGLIVGLDQVKDPQNLGAIFRTVEALGGDGLFFPASRNAPVNEVVRRISIGASEFLPYSIVTNVASSLKKLKKQGFLIFGTSLAKNSENLEEVALSRPIVLMFGSEEDGLRRLTEELCDKLVYVKHYGMVESLNVASAVSACLFYVRSKLEKE